MLNGSYVSIKAIAERVYKTGLNEEEIGFYDLVELVGQALAKIGVLYAYQNKIATITIVDYRGTLPTDIVSIISVREDTEKVPMLKITGTFPPTYQESNLENDNDPTMLGYRVENEYIYTNIEDGTLEVSYTAFVTDTDGFPKVPDAERFIEAVVAYCNYKIAQRLYLQDKISRDKFYYLEMEWYWYVKSAAGYAHLPNIDQAEALKNQLVRLKQSSSLHGSQLNYLNTPEILTVQ